MPHDLTGCDDTELIVAGRHLEDLEVFVGQRSRLHPGPGWAAVLGMLRADLQDVRAEQRHRAAVPGTVPAG